MGGTVPQQVPWDSADRSPWGCSGGDKLAAAHGLVIDDIIGTRTRDQRAHDGSGSVVV
jgi:hypothetical protein